MKIKNAIMLLATAFALLLFSGCDPEDNAVTGFLYEKVGGSYMVVDQFGNTIIAEPAEVEAVAEMTPTQQVNYLTARFKQSFPEDYADESTKAQAQITEQDTPEVKVSDEASAVVDGMNFIPGYGQIASLVANGILGIGTLWYNRRKNLAQKVNESLVKGIDVFRDMADRTPQGRAIDDALKRALKDQQLALGTVNEVNKLLQRYATPTKESIPLAPAATATN